MFSAWVLQYKSVFRSYSQDFMPHHQASVQPFLPPTSSSSPHFPPVHASQSSDLAVPTVSSPPPSTVDGPLSSSQDSSFHGNPVRLPSETSFTDSVRTQHAQVCALACRVLENNATSHRGPCPPSSSPVCCWFEATGSMNRLALMGTSNVVLIDPPVSRTKTKSFV